MIDSGATEEEEDFPVYDCEKSLRWCALSFWRLKVDDALYHLAERSLLRNISGETHLRRHTTFMARKVINPQQTGSA